MNKSMLQSKLTITFGGTQNFYWAVQPVAKIFLAY
jgi:hypothetical protein